MEGNWVSRRGWVRIRPLIIGSRKSKLALVQARLVKAELEAAYPKRDFQIKTIKTTGDKILDVPLSKIGDKGLFTKEIEEALLRKEIDIAVHSMKDLPCELPEGLRITAVSKREDPCDVLVSRTEKGTGYFFNITNGFQKSSLSPFLSLPSGAKIGTSSLRRRAQVLHIREDLSCLDLRGNLDTRLKKLEEGLYDAIILAAAGIKRLGLQLNTTAISTEDILPQAGQGSLGIETRGCDSDIENLVKVLDDPDSHVCIDAERGLLAGLGGGCQVPIGVLAVLDDDQVSIKAGVFSLDGKTAVRDEIAGPKEDAHALGRKLAESVLKKGGRQILNDFLKEEKVVR